MIVVENIKKSFAEQSVLKGISAEFYPGQCNLVIGTSGAGKTVFLKCLVGLHKPDTGNILYSDRKFNALKAKEQKKLRQEMGMLFQGNALFDSMTVEENIRFPLDMFTSKSDEEKRHRVQECLQKVNLTGAGKKVSWRNIRGYDEASRHCTSNCHGA